MALRPQLAPKRTCETLARALGEHLGPERGFINLRRASANNMERPSGNDSNSPEIANPELGRSSGEVRMLHELERK